ncbi:655_t:CDS:10 [Diversispora eburnea]|uniref:655_t:CDS:1 n=2 Tax=Diversisporales TaxID=214509 RepID=A0A9N8YZ48_9GLOM|nr:655_t:CDS:10 [Diversispora eburnea]
MASTFPLLSEIAFDYMWLPISSCAVEWSFSVYNNILSDNRQNLSTESLKILNMITSTLDWCEENYKDHKCIAEFINTLTNILFIGLALFGVYNTAKQRLEKRFIVAYGGIALIGIGSWMFHMTLLYQFQLLDELPMQYATCILAYNIFETGSKTKYGIYLPLGLLTYAIGVTTIYLRIVNPVFHQVTYGILVTIINVRSYYLLGFIPKGKTHKTLKDLLFVAWTIFGTGFVFWNIDNIACDNLRLIRAKIGKPFGYLMEFHGWWHICTAIGGYYWIVFNQYLRVLLLGDISNWKLKWGFFDRIPYLNIQNNSYFRRNYHTDTTKLPNKVPFIITQEGKGIQSPQPIIGTSITEIEQTVDSKYGKKYKLKWPTPPQNVLIIKKPNTTFTADRTFVEVIEWLHETYPNLNIIIESEVAEKFRELREFAYAVSKVDFIITLGGDGTILHTSSLFDQAVPPVISFSMGTLGFLLQFHIEHYQQAISDLIKGDVSLLLRMRLACSLWTAESKRLDIGDLVDLQAMNEVSLHRGRFPNLAVINCFVDDEFLTEAVADGLVVATPTGSTAYSLSAGGPIVHPSVQSLLITPICPRSLSFRPALIPPTAKVKLEICGESRLTEVTIDGKKICMLSQGDFLEVKMSSYPIPCVNRIDKGIAWVKDINNLLKWNQSFVNKKHLIHELFET